MTTLEELQIKRKAAVIIVCTLGLAATPLKTIFEGAKDADKGTSFEGNAVGFTVKCLFFLLFAIPIATIMFVIHIFKLIYYSVEINKLKS
ncbi:MAG: hypothetical protein LBE13_22045 [Bacteroidales bacterium]|jgi:hypothetical protein|nr:hypothetical protein [Bacteroidales bacterium]